MSNKHDAAQGGKKVEEPVALLEEEEGHRNSVSVKRLEKTEKSYCAGGSGGAIARRELTTVVSFRGL
ncbi:hypothetical protein R1flu_019038 [Riccia fluitans]|uniref:Uncharacterized protein n=1 Tax=Riccia fluitans TaxID=41844 RepID=A0ABD1ZHJ8_9MARC